MCVCVCVCVCVGVGVCVCVCFKRPVCISRIQREKQNNKKQIKRARYLSEMFFRVDD